VIVDPWGAVLTRLPRGSGIAVADIDAERCAALRRRFPVLTHRRLGL
jgi:nitrilase